MEVKGRKELAEREAAARLKRERVEAGDFANSTTRKRKSGKTLDGAEAATSLGQQAATTGVVEKAQGDDVPPAAMEETSALTPQQLDSLTVKIKLSSDSVPFYHPRVEDRGDFDFEGMSPREKLKCEVFASLWESGHYLSQGLKFGGDFLVYTGTRPSVSS